MQKELNLHGLYFLSYSNYLNFLRDVDLDYFGKDTNKNLRKTSNVTG